MCPNWILIVYYVRKNGALNKKRKLAKQPEVAEATNISQMPSQSYYELLAHIK